MSELLRPALVSGNRVVVLTTTLDGRIAEPGSETTISDDREKWIIITPPNVRLHPHLEEIVLREANFRPDIDIFYGDEAIPGTGQNSYDLILKPELDVTLLIADDYIGFPLIVRASAMHRLGLVRSAAKTAGIYDLVLRAISGGFCIGRITDVLGAHEQMRVRSDIDDRQRVLRSWLGESAPEFDIDHGLAPGTSRLKRCFSWFPEVTLVIPTRQSVNSSIPDASASRPFISNFLHSIAATEWPMDRLQVLIGDDISDDAVYANRHWPFHLRRIVTDRPRNSAFNYAAKMNKLWRAASTEHVVLMNDDMTIRSPDWLQALLTFSMQQDVGGVGARLLYPNGTIQHAGMIGGLFDLCAHAWMGEPASAPTYQNWALVHREWSMVTGAVFATRKSLLELVNGFDERFTLEFNDVDLCLRLRMLGYRIVYTPFAELTHYEKASRGALLPRGSELALFLKRWKGFLQEDPAYHPRLARQSFQIAPAEPTAGWWQTI